MAVGKDAFMILVVLVMLGVAGYLADMMRLRKSHQEVTLGIFIMKNGEQVSGRMRLTEEQMERANRVDVADVNGLIVSGRKTDRERVISNREQVLKEQSIEKRDQTMRDIESKADQEKDRIDRQIGNVIWNQGAESTEAQRKSIANNTTILQRAVKEAIEVESRMTEKHQQALQELENLSAQMTNHTVLMTAEAKKKLEHLRLVEENSRRAKEAAAEERGTREEEERDERSIWWAIKRKILSMLACSNQSPC